MPKKIYTSGKWEDYSLLFFTDFYVVLGKHVNINNFTMEQDYSNAYKLFLEKKIIIKIKRN